MRQNTDTAKKIFSPWELICLWLVGIGLIMLSGSIIQINLMSNIKTNFINKTSIIKDKISEELGTLKPISTALVGVYQSGDVSDTSALTGTSEELTNSYPSISLIAHAKAVPDRDRSKFELEMHQAGIHNFIIKQFYSEKQLATANTRDKYLPIRFVEKLTPANSRYLGYDLLSDTRFAAAFKKAVATGKPIPVFPVDRFNSSMSYVLIKATYYGHHIPETANDRIEQADGAFLISLELTGILAEIQSNFPEIELVFEALKYPDHNKYLTGKNIINYQLSSNPLFQFLAQKKIPIEEFSLLLSLTSIISMKEIRHALTLFILIAAVICTGLAALTFMIRARRLAEAARNKAREEMFREREKAEVTLQSIGDAVVTIDTDNTIRYMNTVAEKLLNIPDWKTDSLDLEKAAQFVDKDTNNIISHPIRLFRTWAEQKLARKTLMLLGENKHATAVDSTASLLKDAKGEETGMVLVFKDLSVEQELSNALTYQTNHDLLTGLLNRYAFKEKLKQAIDSGKDLKQNHAAFYLDLDQFKLINDTCGHTEGDEMLKQVSALIKAQLRKNDVLARLGGDEFGLLIHNCDLDLALEISKRLLETIRTFRFKSNNQIFHSSVSIGVLPIIEGKGTVAEILSSIDLACHMAKETGRDNVHVYQPGDTEVGKRHGEMHWLPRLQKALRKNRFTLYLQEIHAVNPKDRPDRIYEFLVRLLDDNDDLVPPGLFIPAAERYDLMRQIDAWVVRNAVEYIHERHDKLSPDRVMFTINLSGQSIGDLDTSNLMLETLKKSRVNPKLICFEVTETAAITNYSNAMGFINRLRDHGCYLALDDFGSGLSSFGYLKQLPIDFLKIDGQFVKNIVQDSVDEAMVRTIINMAQVFNLKTIAEFVENQDVLNSLKDMNADYAQGYHLAKPLPAREIVFNSNPEIS